jgi:O-antigen/teichoic acid export membrane protein
VPETMTGGTGRGVAISAVGNLFPPLAALVSAPILAQSLGVVGRGEVAAGTAPLVLGMGLFSLAIPEAVTYFTAKGNHLPRSVLGRGMAYLIVLGALGTILLVLLAPILSGGDDDLTFLIVLGSFALTPSLVLGGVRGAAIGWQKWHLVSAERLVGAVARLGTIAVLSALGALTPLTGTATMAATSFIGIIVYLFLPGQVSRTTRLPGSAYDRLIGQPALVRYGLSMWAGSLTGILLSRLSQTLMVPLASAHELGLYAVAVSVSEVVLVFNSAVRDVMFSVESAGNNDKRLSSATRISTALTVVSAIGVGTLSVWGIPFLFGEGFADAVPVTLILLVGIVLGNPGSVAGAGLSARGRPGLRSIALAVALVFNIVALVTLVPLIGALGAAVATVVGNTISGGLVLVWLRVFFGIPVTTFLGVRFEDIRVFLRQLNRLRKRNPGQ